MPSFYKRGGKMLSQEQVVKWRQEENYKNLIFCDWCISGGVRHKKSCPTVQEGFNPETTPKMTLPERKELIKQRDLNKVN